MEHLRFCGSLNIACGYAGEQGFCTLTRCPVVLDEFQAMRRHQGPTGPKGRPDGYGNAGGNMMKSTCRGCGAPIVWIRTAAGKSTPLHGRSSAGLHQTMAPAASGGVGIEV